MAVVNLFRKFQWKSIHKFFSYPANSQTDRKQGWICNCRRR